MMIEEGLPTILLIYKRKNINWGFKFLSRCTKILSQHHHFLSFLPSPFLLCKNTFMDDYDGIWNCNDKNMVLLKDLTTFDSLFLMEIKI